ncbi:MAG TPA: DUF402 domain-containing protein [Bacillota bacterium]|nr:DUF402 domain-containing protein [Bacillota bacterium]HPF42402.1 DUF402 domain-containing protein [Bacillota bacterium]HPJ85385.1 DUF402 domain-containing protein [Bacillota bacterium]HPQ61319.1 DUF402 domain-containing protein [Bacillota bacterium]HRX91434.1 DUF402 domain-containing protein [Candidatus Izemoplasmatales bacterium]
MEYIPGTKIKILSFKHDGTLHRIWEESVVVKNEDEWMVVANRKTKVIEGNGRFWFTKEPCVSFFSPLHWYNVIGIIRSSGISFYCNLSSPLLTDEEGIKYIDYDLDIKVMPDLSYTILDKNEYRRHSEEMSYSEELKKILETEFEDLEKRIKNREFPFSYSIVKSEYAAFKKIGAKNKC